MKHFRFKMIGFGLAALAGSAIAADDGQSPAKQAGESVKPNLVVQGKELPKQSSSEVRFNSKAGSLTALDPLWFSAGKPTIMPAPTTSTSSGPIVASALMSDGSSD